MSKKRKMITVVTGGRGRPAQIMAVEPTLEEFQRLVNGSIEYRSDGAGLALYMNEEGRYLFNKEEPIHFFGVDIVGPVMVFGGTKSGSEQSLTTEQAERIRLELEKFS